MEKTERTVSELSTLFRMLQVIPEADSTGKIYQMLLAFCTTWSTIGFQRAFLLLVDSKDRVARGYLATERVAPPDAPREGQPPPSSFESMAKNVFQNYEQIESSDLTLKARSFSVPLDWHRSAIVKSVVSEFPVLAEGRTSEFSTDPFFDFFGTSCYIALPLKVHGRVMGVLAADNGITEQKITVEDVSLTYSLTQQASLAIERLFDSTDNKRKFRILKKLQDVLKNVDSEEKLSESMNLALSMIFRAVGATGCFFKDVVRKKTLHIKAVDEYTVDASANDESIGECFEEILDRAAGTMKPVRGDSTHALLNEVVAESVRYFFACPLAVGGDSHGALAVYVEKDQTNRKHNRFEVKNKVFFELCAGLIAEKLNAIREGARTERCENLIEEIRANLTREKETSRIGSRALDQYDELAEELDKLKTILFSKGTYQKRIEGAKELLLNMVQNLNAHYDERGAMKFSLKMTDLFKVVEEVVTPWKAAMQKKEVDVTLRIPKTGPWLLLNKEKISLALQSILKTLSSCVTEQDNVMIECSTDDDKAMICIADTGTGLPGGLLTRLFMPFTEIEQGDEHKSAMSLAGDILHRHAGEIMIKSSPAWNTVLVISFPLASNKDRRQRGGDRRRHPRDRRSRVPRN